MRLMIKNNKPRILHCPTVSLYQPYLYVKGLRELGYEADYMVHWFAPFKWLARDCDYDLDLDGRKGLQIEKTRELEFFRYAVEHYDIFHFHSAFGLFNEGYSFWGRLDELNFLKKSGKKIIMSWWGCGDARTDEMEKTFKFGVCDVCEPSIKNNCKNSVERKKAVEKAFKYADIHLSPGDLPAACRKIQWIDNAVDCNEFRPMDYSEIPEKFRLPKTDKIRIYHSFGNSEIRGDAKGTKYIRQAVAKLQTQGYNVEFIFFDKVPNKDIKYFQAQADIAVDQLFYGWHGSTAAECLSMGKPVITYIRPEVAAIVPQKHPLINANIENIYNVLKNLLDNPEEIRRIGAESRNYALKFHHYLKVAEKLGCFYEE